MSIQNKIKGLSIDTILKVISALFLVFNQIKSLKDGNSKLEVVELNKNGIPDNEE